MFALSYDEQDALAAYADEYGVTFPLLSDPKSEIIESFGILNTLIDADDHPWYGIPFPGTYVIDADGIIIAKFFESNMAIRANADQLRRAAIGEEVTIEPLSEPPSEVTADVSFDGESLAVGVVRDLLVTFRVPEGQHLYGEPVPSGMVATSVEFDESEGLVTFDPQFPPTHKHTLSGTGEELQVYEGDVVVRIPITHNQRSIEKLDDGSRVVRVSGTLRWQSCDDEVCHLPVAQPFELALPALRSNTPEFRRKEGSTRMDTPTHFAKMTERRKEPQ